LKLLGCKHKFRVEILKENEIIIPRDICTLLLIVALVIVDKNGRNLCIHHLTKGLKGEGWREHSQVS
jgi:hypothetical protein